MNVGWSRRSIFWLTATLAVGFTCGGVQFGIGISYNAIRFTDLSESSNFQQLSIVWVGSSWPSTDTKNSLLFGRAQHVLTTEMENLPISSLETTVPPVLLYSESRGVMVASYPCPSPTPLPFT